MTKSAKSHKANVTELFLRERLLGGLLARSWRRLRWADS